MGHRRNENILEEFKVDPVEKRLAQCLNHGLSEQVEGTTVTETAGWTQL
jgi:hypothetical protein